MKSRLAPSTFRHRHGAVARCFDLVIRKHPDIMAQNPLRLLKRGFATYNATDQQLLLRMGKSAKIDVERNRRLTAEEEGAILSVLVSRPVERMFFTLALETAMRMRKCYTLHDKQVAFSQRTIHLDRSKNGDNRQVPMTHDIARRVIVVDFAPVNRPEFMYPDLRDLKEKPLSDQIRERWNAGWEDLVGGRGFGAGLPEHAQFDVASEFKDDMAQHWSHSGMTTMDAFYHYYSFFTRDEDDFERRMGGMKTHVKVVWGKLDPYINKAMGEELAERLGVEFKLLAGIGHYPHNQDPELVAAEIRASFV